MNHLLSLLIFLPLVGGLVLLALSRKFASVVKPAALGIALINLLLVAFVGFRFQPQAGFQMEEKLAWIPKMGIEYHLAIDGISLFLVLLIPIFILIALCMAQFSKNAYPPAFFALLLCFEAGLLGTTLALNLFLFYLFWELMLIPAFFLIGLWGGPKRKPAVLKFVIYTMAGSLVFLLSILFLGVQFYSKTGEWSFALPQLYQMRMGMGPVASLLFFGFALAFLIKVPLFPLHTWLPDTYSEAPTVVTFLLSGLMAKMGIYGLLRITIPLFPQLLERWAPLLSLLAIAGIVYGAIAALGQTDLKRLIAYSSLSHMSLLVLGVFTWNQASLQGTLYHMINHAVATGALFLLVSLIEEHYGTTEIAELGGLAKETPLFASLFLLMTFASIGVPGLNGFVGEFLILLGVTTQVPLLGLGAGLTLILSAAYMLWLTQRLLFGPLKSPVAEPLKLCRYRQVVLAPLVLAVVLMGLYTQPVFERTTASVRQYLQMLHQPQQVSEPTLLSDTLPASEAQIHG
jgi:NADH-quinone oxidoreductase subunit M